MATTVVATDQRVISRWWQLVSCIVAMMAIANLQYAWTLFTIPLTKSLQTTLSAVQITFTIFILVETWLVPFEGYLVDRLGARLVVSVGGLLVGLGWIGSGLTHSLGALYAWYALGCLGEAPYTAPVWAPPSSGSPTGAAWLRG
jgi:OFA family oxalate/formate antiporter-like MFS transporter